MERVGEEGVVRALVSLDQGVKLREPAVAQTAQWVQKRREGWSKQSSFQTWCHGIRGRKACCVAHGGQAAWDSVRVTGRN